MENQQKKDWLEFAVYSHVSERRRLKDDIKNARFLSEEEKADFLHELEFGEVK